MTELADPRPYTGHSTTGAPQPSDGLKTLWPLWLALILMLFLALFARHILPVTPSAPASQGLDWQELDWQELDWHGNSAGPIRHSD
ncbi:hypothetical protein [Celeribacter neptunius]|uniref:Uncharacterized protein n=1 Tax=Celeribacter neptunius TaxID=588602 RepID=A0A1I3KLC2_9RHOB|nr:hypothetical protein [Celeribacter neptunius]SFI73299.1 hypothetical protein SAMN04487991_0730 [Celeribacter neptunius]